ncbi:MAG: hypothetical protein Q8Q31_05340 [Nanoarchaeota archaeon]|nr:hypothetical protein [Nanoarchaeota archaeon]
MSSEKIFYLDWRIQRLFGWETEKSDLVVDAIIRGIEARDDFPPVPVHYDRENIFYISPLRENAHNSQPAGGHNRAVGHFIAHVSLKCELLNGPPIWPDEMCIEIPDIRIVDDRGQYAEQRTIHLAYR